MTRPAEAAYEYIKQRILDGTFRPSQKLTENELSDNIGVSRNTVKKALLKLEQENLVRIEENKGASIQSYTLDEVKNLLEIREVLEGLAIRSVAESISDEDLQKMESIFRKMKTHLANHEFDDYSNLNKKFHQIIYRTSNNQQAVSMIHTLKNQLNRFHFRTILIPGRHEESLKEHQQILSALRSHDAKEAENAVMYHIGKVRETIDKHYSYLV